MDASADMEEILVSSHETNLQRIAYRSKKQTKNSRKITLNLNHEQLNVDIKDVGKANTSKESNVTLQRWLITDHMISLYQ